jgi:mRNA interferase MazF
MKRGELWVLTASGYASKPRPALIIQSDRYDLDDSVVTCLVTTEDVIEKEYRVAIPASKEAGGSDDCSPSARDAEGARGSGSQTRARAIEPDTISNVAFRSARRRSPCCNMNG